MTEIDSIDGSTNVTELRMFHFKLIPNSDGLHVEERLWEGAEEGGVGPGSANATWTPQTRYFWKLPRQKQGVIGAC